MARLKAYTSLTTAPGGRSFYSTPRKRVRKRGAPLTAALKGVLAKRRQERQQGFTSALQMLETWSNSTLHNFKSNLADILSSITTKRSSNVDVWSEVTESHPAGMHSYDKN
jgi:hypothetical protein